MAVTQAVEEQEVAGQEGPSAEAPTTFDSAVSEFLAYIEGYRHYSSWTVGAYRIDLREFRGFLQEQVGRVPSPSEITRPQPAAAQGLVESAHRSLRRAGSGVALRGADSGA